MHFLVYIPNLLIHVNITVIDKVAELIILTPQELYLRPVLITHIRTVVTQTFTHKVNPFSAQRQKSATNIKPRLLQLIPTTPFRILKNTLNIITPNSPPQNSPLQTPQTHQPQQPPPRTKTPNPLLPRPRLLNLSRPLIPPLLPNPPLPAPQSLPLHHGPGSSAHAPAVHVSDA